MRRAPARFGRASRTLNAADPAERLLAASGRIEPGASAASSSAGRSPSSTADAALADRARASRRRRRRPAARRALPRRAARPRRRHAPLLRPRVDGAFARGARSVPRPPARRVLRDDSLAPQGAAARHEARAEARRPRARPRPDHRQAEDRLLPHGGRRLVPGPDARRDQRLPARAEPALRRDARPRRGRAARARTTQPEPTRATAASCCRS